MIRLYHLFANETQQGNLLMTHRQACTMKSKFTIRENVNIELREIIKMNTQKINDIRNNCIELGNLSHDDFNNTDVTVEMVESLEHELDFLEKISKSWFAIIEGGIFTIFDGQLYSAPINADNSFNIEELSEITAPENQDFLDKINSIFFTQYKLDQFAGR